MRASIFFLLLPLPPLLYSSLSFIIYYPSSACFDILLPYSRLVGCWDAPWFSFFFFWLPVSLIVFIWISSWCLKMLQDASGCFRMLQGPPLLDGWLIGRILSGGGQWRWAAPPAVADKCHAIDIVALILFIFSFPDSLHCLISLFL